MITFVIPTIGRESLPQTLESLIKQSVPDWKAVVVFDGIEPSIQIVDPRISVARVQKTGWLEDNLNGRGGYVRNAGIKLADTEWIGFVDDDDALDPTYIEALKAALAQDPIAEVVIFRMKFWDGGIKPKLGAATFELEGVGISFCVRRRLFAEENFWFVQSHIEDFLLLDTLRRAGKRIVLSSAITYLIRPHLADIDKA
jgi:glycosyltransferase involved in cell wall biosynthesis